MAPSTGLFADIGGTNARLALLNPAGKLTVSSTLLVGEDSPPERALTTFLHDGRYGVPTYAAIAAARPVDAGRCDLTAKRSPAPRPILLYADAHGDFNPLLDACHRLCPRTVILLGDAGLPRPLSEVLPPAILGDAEVLWIHGNHDADRQDLWDNLTNNQSGALSGRIVQVADTRIAGLGGVYRGKVWLPRHGDEAPASSAANRAAYLQDVVPKSARWRGGLPLRHRATIFPEDHAILAAKGPADVLVTHEAPSSSEMGFGAIDDLALALGVRLVVHGHLHKAYQGTTRHGIPVRGLGKAEAWALHLP